MLQSKKAFVLTPKMKRVVSVTVAAIVILVGSYLFLTRDRGGASTVSEPSAGGGAVQVKSTAFNGVDINTDDPVALRAYCEDIITSGEASGDQIRDLCVLNDIVREHLPSLSNAEIQDMAKNSPSCLQTGFDADGFNCFTGFDENNCSREGIDPEGNVCDPSLANKTATNPVDSLFSNNADVCSIVSGCQAESEFDENGENRFGCNREGRRSDGTMCPAEFITRLYDDNNRDQLGFSPQGFNEFQCDIQGLRADGSKCPLEQVTRVYDKNNFDQWGFHQDSFNKNGCDINGLNRDGNACALEDITRIIDPKTGLDQFGISEDGYNENGCSLEGYNRSGVLCKLEDITRIIGKDGKDQFGIFESGFNDAGCSIEGLRADGTACKLEDAPRLFNSETGTDQFSFFKNNKNKYGCDELGARADGTLCPIEQISKIIGKNNLDANGLTIDGFAENGCSTAGFRRNGKRCDSKDIPRVYDASTGLDQFQLDKDGFSLETGCNLEGFNRDGERCSLEDTPRIFDPETGLDQFSLTKSGFTKEGCGLDGLNAMGQVCSSKDIPRIVDPVTGLDQFDLDSDGFHFETGCNLEGYNREGVRCEFEDIPQIVGKDGVNQLGLTASGRNAAGCDINGIKEDGTVCTEEERTKLYGNDGISQYHKNSDGFSRLGVNDMQYNEFNCNLNGQKPNGELCDINEITRVYDPKTGLDQFGLTEDGYNEHGCSLEGVNRDSEACLPEHIPRIFSSDMKDQFGTPINELPDSVWLNELAKKSGLSPLLDESGKPVFKDGKAVFVGKDGILRNADGVALRDSYGGVLKSDSSGKITDSKGQVVPSTLFENKDGIPLSGPFKVAAPGNDKLKKLTSQSGSPVSVKGKPAFVDEQGMLVDSEGNYILGDNGNPLRLNEDGDIVDSEGSRIDTNYIKDAQGNEVRGKLLTRPVSKHAQVSSLTTKDGEPLLVDGKPAYVDDSGYLIDNNGELILSEDGLPLRLDPNGNIYDANGNVIEKSRLTNLLGEPAEGPFSSRNMSDDGILTAANGEPVMIDGEAAYLDKHGFIRNAKGELLKGENGQPLRLNKNGDIVNSAGEKIDSKRLTLKSGNSVNGPIQTGRSKERDVLTTANGETVTIDGEKAFVRKDGVITDALGNPILGKDGKPLRLNASGEVVDSNGRRVRGSRLKTVDGKTITGPLHAEDKSSSSLLTDSTGEPVMIDGEAAYLDKDGFIRNAKGELIKGDNGQPLRLNENGDIVNSAGEKVDPKRLTLKTGSNVDGPIRAGHAVKYDVLTTANGETVTIDGEKAFVRKDGVITDALGNPILGNDGKPLRLNATGEVVDSSGRRVRSSRLKTVDGGAVTGPLHAEDKNSSALLTDSTGEPILIDGKAAFVDEDGVLRDAQGNVFEGSDGKPLKLNSRGEVIDSSGDVIDDERLSTITGKKLRKPLKSKNQISQNALTTLTGEPVTVDGVAAFVDENGILRDVDGALLLDENGKPLTLNEKGQVVDSEGQPISNGRLKTMDGKTITGALKVADDPDKVLSPLVDEDGKIVHYNGEPVIVGKDGKLRNMAGELIFGPNGKTLRLDDKGQVINSDGEVITADHFQDSKGNALDGEFHADTFKSKTQIEAAAKADALSEDERSALQLDEDGYNPQGCDLNGRDRNGDLCELEDMPRVFDEDTGLDQFGLTEDNYNSFGCNLEGLNRNGKKCDDKFIPRIRDSKGIDQLGLSLTGFRETGLNANAENVLGCDAFGEKCGPENSPTITDSQGVTQFGKRSDGKDRLGLTNGFNDAGCGLDGLDAQGKRCALEDIPFFLNGDGLTQFGTRENGYNDNNCNIKGLRPDGSICPLNEVPRIFDKSLYDQFNLNSAGRNAAGCNLAGFKVDGTRCNAEDIPRMYDAQDIDQFGLDKEGFSAKTGCNLNGINRKGQRCSLKDTPRIFDPATGLDQFSIGKDGFNDRGCNLEGLGRDGKVCAYEDITLIYDEETGKNQLGFGKDSYNDNGCDFYGYRSDGTLCKPEDLTRIVGADNKDQYNIDVTTNMNEKGCDIYGRRKDGKRCKPENMVRFVNASKKDQFGLVKGYNEHGCDLNGRKEDGSLCDIEDVTRVVDENTGLDQFELDENHRNEHGCGVDGLDKHGIACSPEKLTHIYDGNGIDQFNLNKDKRNVFECNLLGFKPDGSRCSFSEITSIRGKDGLNQLALNEQGFNEYNEDLEGYDPNGCDAQNRKRDGSFCNKLKDNNLDSDDAAYIAQRKSKIENWLKNNDLVYKQEVETPYIAELQTETVSTTATVKKEPVTSNANRTEANKSVELADASLRNEGENRSNMEDIRIPLAYMTQVNVTTPVNSDYTNTVYGRITLGELAGSVLVGKVVVPYIDDVVMPRDKFYYEFDKLIYERQTISIKAISINPYNDSSMVDADEVDYHRLQRYGGLLFASAVEALDASFLDNQVEQDLEAQSNLIDSIAGTTAIYGQYSRELAKTNLQTATAHVSDLAKQQFTRRPTIKSGPGLTLIAFTQQITDPRIPYVMVGVEH